MFKDEDVEQLHAPAAHGAPAAPRDEHRHDGGDHGAGDRDDHDDHEDHGVEPLADLAPTPVHGYWKSLRELEGKAAFQVGRTGHEFPPEADQPTKDPLSRRNFFHLMGASMALAGVGACRRYEKEEIVPLARRPEDQTPGVTQQYATAFELGGVGHGLLATSFEGRPIKLDGNPEHPFASGGVVPGTERHAGCSTFVQAALLHLYDPDRSQNPTADHGSGSSMDAFRAALPQLRAALATTHILGEASSSPTLRALRTRLLGLGVRLVRVRAAVVGQRARRDPAGVRPSGAPDRPARPRRDHRHARLRPVPGAPGGDEVQPRLRAVAAPERHARDRQDEPAVVGRERVHQHRRDGRSPAAAARRVLPAVRDRARRRGCRAATAPAAEFLQESRVDKFLRFLVEELKDKQRTGKAVVVAGRRQPPEVHALVARINQSLGAPGADARLRRGPRRRPAEPPAGDHRADPGDGRRPGRHADHARRQPGVRRAGRSRLRGGAGQGQDLRPPPRVPQRDLAGLGVARAAGALPRGVGRRADLGRHGHAGPAADRAALRRAVGDRAAVAAARRGEGRRGAGPPGPPGARRRGELEAGRARRLRARHPVRRGDRRPGGVPGPAADPGPAGRLAAHHQQRRRSRSCSRSRASPTTGGSPTTPGCGRRPTSSPR